MTPQARRNYVQAMVELQVSERRSCQLAGMSRSGYRYRRVVFANLVSSEDLVRQGQVK